MRVRGSSATQRRCAQHLSEYGSHDHKELARLIGKTAEIMLEGFTIPVRILGGRPSTRGTREECRRALAPSPRLNVLRRWTVARADSR